ncbi:hypothetical protein PINS_up006312 [Pythium insidiosum]|nr:hypothetical protein PINS_up006312 [Pythium insidiosum]
MSLTRHVHAADRWGITPLMLAATCKDKRVIGALFGFSTLEDLTCGDSNGNTALHYSYAFCLAEVSTMIEDELVNDTETTNHSNETALQVTGYRLSIFPSGARSFEERLSRLKKHRRSRAKPT